MTKLNVNIGLSVNDKTGDTLRSAFDKINTNFTELYTLTGGTSADLRELAQDYAAPLFTHASHTNITVTYDDANNKILLTGAAPQVQSNWTASSGLGVILNKPTIPAAQVQTDWNAVSGLGVILNKPTLFSGSYTDLTSTPTIPTSFSSLVNSTKTVSLDTDGATTFPNTVKFRSGSNLSLSIGYSYGAITQGTNAVALGAGAGIGSQGDYATALGGQSGGYQSYGATAVGCFAGGNYQGIGAVAIGLNAGSGGGTVGTYTPTGSTGTTLKFVLPDGLPAPVVGMAVRGTGFSTQTVVSVDSATQVTLSAPPDSTPSSSPAAIQFYWAQGDFSIAIGNTAGASANIATPSIASKTIILNASNVALSGVPRQTDSFYVNPIRTATATSNVLYYNTTTKEITYAAAGSVSSLVNGVHTLSLGSTGNTTFPTGLVLGAPRGVGTVNFTSAIDKEFQIETQTASTGKLWRFETNGNTTLPSGLTFKKNGTPYSTITADLDKVLQIETQTSGGVKQWSLGTDGTTTFPTNISINYSGGNVQFPRIIADSGKAFSVQGQGTSGSAALAWSVDPNADTKYAAVGVSQGGGDNLAKVVMTAGNTTATLKVWKLDETGVFTLPAGGVISEGGGLTGAIKLTPAGGTNAYQSLLIYPTGAAIDGDHIHLTAGGGTTELYLGNDNHYVKLVNGGNVEVRAFQPTSPYATAVWGFGTDGAVSTTKPLIINVPNGVPTGVGAVASTTGSWEQNPLSNLATTGGSGSGLRVNVTYTGGYASAIAIATAGTGYLDGELITVTSGSSSASFTIAVTGTRSWTFGTDGKLTSPGNLQVDGGKIILNTGGNAYVESVDYGVNSANSAVNIFGGPYQKINLRAGFGTQATLTLATDGTLTLPGSIVGTATQAVFNTTSTTVNAFGAATTALNIGASGAPITGFAATATTSSTASSLGYLGLPQSATATTASLAIGDASKHIYVTTASQTITIPANASVAYPIGTTLTFIAGPSATTVTIAITSDTLRLAGGTSTGSRTLAANGMATAVKVAATTWYINGTGLT